MRNENEAPADVAPCLVLAEADPEEAALTALALRRQGWDVYTAGTGPEARRLTRMLQPDLVVLHTDLPDESAWLTCDKLLRELPRAQVILYHPEAAETAAAFARFVGARGLASSPAELLRLIRAAHPTAPAIA